METAFMGSAPLSEFRWGGAGGARAPLPGSGRYRNARRVGPGDQPAIKDTDEGIGDLGGGHRLVLAIPVRDPVERARQREGGHLRVLRVDRTVSGPLVEEPANALIDLVLELLDARHRLGGETEILRPHHASA